MHEDWQAPAITWLRGQHEYGLAVRLANAWSEETEERRKRNLASPPAQALEWEEPTCARWPKCGCPHLYECMES